MPAAIQKPSPARLPRAGGRRGDCVLDSQVTVNDAGAGTSPQPRPYHCCRDWIRCGAGRGTRPQLCHRAGTQSKTVNANPVMGLRPPPKAVRRLFRGCPRALDAGNPPPRPPTGTGGDPLSLPGLGHRPLGPGQDQVSPSNSSRTGFLGRADWPSSGDGGVATSGIRGSRGSRRAAILGP